MPLAARLGLPLIAKDTIKEAVGDVLPVATVEESRRLGRGCIAAMYALVAAQLDVGVGAVMKTPLVLARRRRTWRPWRRAPGRRSCTAAPTRPRCGRGARHGSRRTRVIPSTSTPAAPPSSRPRSTATARPQIGVPVLAVDTAAGYRPSLERVTAWARRRVSG